MWDLSGEAIEAIREILPVGWTAETIGPEGQVVVVSDSFHRHEVYTGDTVGVRGSGVFVVEE